MPLTRGGGQVTASYLEIYNENLCDLLAPVDGTAGNPHPVLSLPTSSISSCAFSLPPTIQSGAPVLGA